MKRRYILAPEAARDLAAIWRYIKKESSQETADGVESVIWDKIAALADAPGAGHRRNDLTSADVRFFAGINPRNSEPMASNQVAWRVEEWPSG